MSRDHSANNFMLTNTPETIANPEAAMVVGSGPSLGSHESLRKENDRYIYIEGYTLTNDHATTGRDWFRLVEKSTDERHSGPRDKLWRIFNGLDTLDSLYA